MYYKNTVLERQKQLKLCRKWKHCCILVCKNAQHDKDSQQTNIGFIKFPDKDSNPKLWYVKPKHSVELLGKIHFKLQIKLAVQIPIEWAIPRITYFHHIQNEIPLTMHGSINQIRTVSCLLYNPSIGTSKWISKCTSHGTPKSIAGHHGWLTRKTFEF